MELRQLKDLLFNNDPRFWEQLRLETSEVRAFEDLFLLSSLRKKALARGLAPTWNLQERLRFALVGGYSLSPFHVLLEHLLEMEGIPAELWQGSFDNYVSEIMDETSGLHAFAPQVVLLMPSENRCRYSGNLTDSRELQEEEARGVAQSILELAAKVYESTRAEVIVTNFMLPSRHDLGPYRSRTMGSDWNFRKRVNLELGLIAQPYVHICDLEYLAYRQGGIAARDERGWFESKQPGSPSLLADFARETVHLIRSFRGASKKVLALDLDNTLWGGVVGDDGLEGIELGDTSPRGEAFKAFQKYIASLQQRGVLLAVCSKNDEAKAAEVFTNHPEMVIRLEDIVSFKVNWSPKSDSLQQMAIELNLGLDSFVFVDDNPAEIEIVRQFAPEVTTILLGPDPANYVAQLQDCRLFEIRNLTTEDAERTSQYRSEAKRKQFQASLTDMDSYLESMEMKAVFSEFNALDVPRLAQLINKSNQFNLTTRRRTEAELLELINDPGWVCFSLRLKDRFGDHGLVCVIIASVRGSDWGIDTWLMSCRVLKRTVEDAVLNELIRLARLWGGARVQGVYRTSPKNEMVRDFYSRMGFTLTSEAEDTREFELLVEPFQPLPTRIEITRHAYDPK